MKKAYNYLLILPLVLFFKQSFAWDFAGHKIIGTIALQYLDPKVKDSLSVYFGGNTLSEESTWMEAVRLDPAYNYLRPFHYINFEKGKQYDSTTQGNIISELKIVMEELHARNKLPKEQISMDLKILCHLIGDLHLPLNVGYAVDRGGNNVSVNFLGTRSDLHKVWAKDIIEQYSISTTDCFREISGYSKVKLNRLKQGDIIAWMYESRELLPQVYDFQNPTIDSEYCEKNIFVIEKQLALSGVRLAEVLTEIFSK